MWMHWGKTSVRCQLYLILGSKISLHFVFLQDDCLGRKVYPFLIQSLLLSTLLRSWFCSFYFYGVNQNLKIKFRLAFYSKNYKLFFQWNPAVRFMCACDVLG